MKTFSELKKYAKTNLTPILRPKSARFLRDLCKEKKPQKILEIGTAIGYSASLMLSCCKNASLVTIEKDAHMALLAKETFLARNLTRQVRLIENDAFEALKSLVSEGEKFDLIFLDGPKGQYFKYLPLLKQLLGKKGTLLADDVLFHGYVKKEGDPGHKHRTIVASLRAFIADLQADESFKTSLLEFEDGLLLCERLK